LYKKIILLALVGFLFNPSRAFSQCPNDFCLDASNGTRLCSKDLHGQPFLVDFWAAWCPKCRAALDWYESPERKAAKSIKTILINLDPEREDAESFLKEQHPQVVTLLDPHGTIAEQCALDSIPAAILFDKDGKETKRWYGFSEKVQQEIGALFNTGVTP
jgi:thiol-disulfide isomerase/thioredoxin